MDVFKGTVIAFMVLTAGLVPAQGQNAVHDCHLTQASRGVLLSSSAGSIDLEILAPNLLRVDVEPHGIRSSRTLVMDPGLKAANLPVSVQVGENSAQIVAPEIQASVTCGSPLTISVSDSGRYPLVTQADPFDQAYSHRVNLLHTPGENLYGMSGLSLRENGGGLLRNNGSVILAGSQGEAGAPWFFTTRYGVLIDSDGGGFDTRDNEINFWGDSRHDTEYFVAAGQPLQVMSALATLTGRPPLPPKWTLGFLNSQWGSTEDEVKRIVATYRAKHIPLDGFIMDYDWKAWGEDDYGEWRWNSTAAPGNENPNKFPDGASGIFGKQMREEGIHLAGILKPRILVYKVGSTTEMHEAAAYATAHDLWVQSEKGFSDYFGGRPSRDLDFSKAATRSWYWQHLESAFDAGVAGWWNDEADNLNNLQFLNMGRMLYEGQRGYSNIRVWSLNRNFYLGSQRYGYAEWSGDIQTGFGSMAHQRTRMLATLDTGEPHWSMDTGGFSGHPEPENYARWMEFAAFVPIDRVHGYDGEKRQPWIYGPVAESAATNAIRLRYSLLPYIYSYEQVATETGIGVVRPLFWMFPDDPRVADEGSSWMFGDALLVSPVVSKGETQHSVYLPAGIWYDYFRGIRLEGGRTISYPVDPKTWQDIPLFIRSGSILASQPSQDYTNQYAAAEISLDVFPSAQAARFVYYDDDGDTYAYEHSVYYRQPIEASSDSGTTHLSFEKPTGSFASPLRFWLIRIHGQRSARTVLLNGKPLPAILERELEASGEKSIWANGQDKYGPLTTIRIPAQQASSIEIR